MALKSRAYIDLSLDLGVHRTRTLTTDTLRKIIFLQHTERAGPGTGWGLW